MRRAAARATASLRHRDFRLLWFGACASSIGTWMQAVAENWLILSLTGSPLYLGLDAFLQQIPIPLLTLFGGVVADRRGRRRMLLVSQIVQMSSAITLALLVFSGHVHVWHILTLSFVSGCAQAFGSPAYLALTPALVKGADVSNAVALNGLQFNVARFLGPLAAGAALMACRKAGVSDMSALGTCFGLNGLSFVVVIAALLSLRVEDTARAKVGNIMEELRAGLTFVARRRALALVVGLSGVVAFTAYPVLTLLPLFSTDQSGSGLEGYSALMVVAGAGAIAGTVLAAWLGDFPDMARATLITAVALGGLVSGFALSRAPWLSYALLFLVGAGLMLVSTTLTALAQRMVPDDMRGRVLAVYLVASRGGMPLGSLVLAYAASLTSAPQVLGVSGMVLVGVSALGLTGGHLAAFVEHAPVLTTDTPAGR